MSKIYDAPSRIAVELVHRFEVEFAPLHPQQREWLEREIAKFLRLTTRE